MDRKILWQDKPLVKLPDAGTIGEIYGPAMEITDQDEASRYYEALVQRNMKIENQTREQAEQIVKSNLGYYAGYYNHETRVRVEKLFFCIHPVFGSASNGPVGPEKAFKMGLELGEKLKKEKK